MASLSCVGLSGSARAWIMLMFPRTAVRILLKSWAIPPTRTPRDSSFLIRTMSSSICLRWETSRTMTITPNFPRHVVRDDVISTDEASILPPQGGLGTAGGGFALNAFLEPLSYLRNLVRGEDVAEVQTDEVLHGMPGDLAHPPVRIDVEPILIRNQNSVVGVVGQGVEAFLRSPGALPRACAP